MIHRIVLEKENRYLNITNRSVQVWYSQGINAITNTQQSKHRDSYKPEMLSVEVIFIKFDKHGEQSP